jgi:predicted RNA binding protein YcfA (HicA-like mRNA interferase family)
MSVNKMIRELKAEGFVVQITKGCHMKITHPEMDGPVFCATSPSCKRASANLRATIKRKMKHETHTADQEQA